MNSLKATVTLTSTVDLAVLTSGLATQVRALAGEAPLSSEQLAALSESVVAEVEQQAKRDATNLAEAMKAALPQGMRLVGTESTRDGLSLASRTTVEVDDISQLAQLTFPDVGVGPMKPFQDFKTERVAGALIVRGQGPETTPEVKVALEVLPATPPRAHNATEVRGEVLTWRGSRVDVRLELPLAS